MKILYINWAPLWLGAEIGGGVNVYAQNMALALQARGHQMYSLSAGYAYNFAGGTYLKRGPDYQGVINYEVINAPNISPGYLLKPNPTADLREPEIEQIFQKLLQDLKPDLVHFNNIEGFSGHCIELAKASGARVVFSLHNYHPVCNQVYQLYQNQEICEDFQDGAKCINCFSPPPKDKEIFKRKLGYHIHLYPEGHLFWGPIHFLKNSIKTLLLWSKLARSIIGVWRERKRLNQQPVDTQPKPEVTTETTFTLHRTEPVAVSVREKSAGLAYKQRRETLVAAINQADLVLSVSTWVSRIFIGMGVDKNKLETCHIGNRIAEMGRHYTHPQPDYSDNKRPIHLVYIGLASQPKGFPFFSAHPGEPGKQRFSPDSFTYLC
ncbi:glycosyltransferase [Candidatus Venteria ishoeyi]|uniref:Glycosyltransferase subfamily 4-like N-terminal domain-containing protein n=1 Tax=Candidatus Venteria ishoeyi TaxID=1899563 RepID=A0A1H6FCD8_9GAMM|nr:glycosyltransferase [Candidatus Venteria ishoeyi]SEH06704.1 Uncharacterised protein [Candidatus Venteria ishoeyi]